MFKSYTLNCRGRLVELNHCMVMGILNVTPDSFYPGSRTPEDDPEGIRRRVRQILDEGGEIIDVGAYSTRPGAPDVSERDEMHRLAQALTIVRQEAPEAIVSVDTFRASVAASCVEDFGVDIINDISAGELDRQMYRTVGRLNVPYVAMHMQGTPRTMQSNPHYTHVTAEVIEYLAHRAQMLYDCGCADVIADPGFGFGKTIDHNYQMMRELDAFAELDMPLLVGISRKSMIYRHLGISPDEALTGTTVLNAFAAAHGTHILRVHDVRAAVDTVKITQKLCSY